MTEQLHLSEEDMAATDLTGRWGGSLECEPRTYFLSSGQERADSLSSARAVGVGS